MAHIPMGDIQELWNQTPQHSWSALHQTLQNHRDKAQGISNTLVVEMLQITTNLQKENHPFPDSQQKLYDLLNQRLQAGAHR